MPQLDVRLTSDYIYRMVRVSPIEALEELIWNALDADATFVKIHFKKNLLEGIDEVYIADNGHGIELEYLKLTFGNLGVYYGPRRPQVRSFKATFTPK